MKKKTTPQNKKNLTRRDFISYSSAGAAVIILGPVAGLNGDNIQQAGSSWPDDAGKYRFHMIGQAHRRDHYQY